MPSNRTQRRLDLLRSTIHDLESVLVGFSGGLDSTFLLAVAVETLGADRAVAATVTGPIFPRRESYESRHLARMLGAEQIIVEAADLDDERFTANPPDRCYYCKRGIFARLLGVARERGLKHVIDGTNADDDRDYRPGLRACRELGVEHPLAAVGMGKADIRALSAEMGLPTRDKPPGACLASRIPYGETITLAKLERIDKAEEALRELGFRQLRVRSHGDVARIEVTPQESIARMLDDRTRVTVVAELKELGFHYVALDLEGYRRGSMNVGLNDDSSHAG